MVPRAGLDKETKRKILVISPEGYCFGPNFMHKYISIMHKWPLLL